MEMVGRKSSHHIKTSLLFPYYSNFVFSLLLLLELNLSLFLVTLKSSATFEVLGNFGKDYTMTQFVHFLVYFWYFEIIVCHHLRIS